jgi:hypothetical protein
MSEALLKEIALQVVQQGLLSNWLFYAVLLGLNLVGGAITACVSSYLRERGKVYATKADFDEILRQLAKTTEVAEQVRSAVSHADWVAREWKTIRRIKLEELVDSAISVKTWSNNLLSVYDDIIHENRLSDERKNENRRIRFSSYPAEKTSTISVLYFPYIQTQLPKMCQSLYRESIAMKQLASKAEKESLEKNQFIDPAEFGWDKQNSILLNIIDEIKNEAAKIMNDIEREDGRKEKLRCS